MKSDVYVFEKGGVSVIKANEEVRKVAGYNGLTHKQELRLDLLAEELLGMLPNLLCYGSGKFWIENKGNEYELHAAVEIDDVLPTPERDRILSVSTTGENAAAKGIMNKIRIAAEIMLANYAQSAATTGMIYTDTPYAFYDMGAFEYPAGYSTMWSLSRYKDEAKEDTEAWDELEKSLIAKLADDVTVGIIGSKVEITVKKKF
ncbi:MAG: hypothetical protein II820_00950 [Ruminiclostridium sp.]|nr:hypothetical protein [Ruminiclostridium sp.]